MSSDSSRARRGITTTLASQAVKFGIQTASTIVLARLLIPDDFGLFAMVVAITGFATLIGDFGLSTAAIQARELTHAQRSNLFWLSLGIGVTLAVVVALAAGLVADFYGRSEIAPIVQVISLNFIVASASSQFTANLTREFRFGWLAIGDVAGQGCALAVAIGLASLGAGVWALVAQQLTISLVVFVVSVIGGRWLPGLPRRAPMSGLLRFGAGSFGVQALTYLSSNVDSIVLGRVAGAAQLGLYDQAYRLFKVPVQQIASPLTRVALPLLSRRQGDILAFTRLLVAAQTGMSYVLGSVFVIGAALAGPAVISLLGERWAPAVPLFAVLAVGGLFQSMGYVYYWMFLSLGLTGLQLRYSLVTRAVMVIAIVLASTWGATGVAIAVSASLAFNWVVLTVFPLRKTGLSVRPVVSAAVRSFVIHLIVGGIVAGVDLLFVARFAENWARLACGGSLALVLYVASFALLPGLRSDAGPVFRLVFGRWRRRDM